MAIEDQDTIIRFLHILSGIVWIGMLYFFNLVNLPLLKFSIKKPYEFNMAEKATAHIVGKTLFWFRWGAASTVFFGFLLLYINRSEYQNIPAGIAGWHIYAILGGALLALIMAFNVWAIIWPRQQKILANNKAIAAATDEAEKKRLGDLNAPMAKTATMASRANTWLSVPMLWGMVLGAHGDSGALGTSRNAWLYAVFVLVAVLALMALYANSKPKKA